jgi:hypothetical protein
MAVDLLKKRADIAQRHANLEEFNDFYKELAKDGDKITDRIIAFQCDDEIVFVGPDVKAVRDAAAKFQKDVAPLWQKATNEPLKAMAVARITKLLAAEQGTELRLATQAFNAVVAGLSEVGEQFSVSDGAASD